MNVRTLRETQEPLKMRYRDDPTAALHTLTATGDLDGEGIACRIETGRVVAEAGIQPATDGSGQQLRAGGMLLEALVACAGVTLRAVATAMDVEIRGGVIRAEGELDFRGTLGVAKDVPVGFRAIRLRFEVDSDAEPHQLATLLRLTERYCVVYQTLRERPPLSVDLVAKQAG